MQTKLSTILLLFFSCSTLCYAQTNHGFTFDNYSGIYGVTSNPANSVDSKYSIHINLLSFNQFGVSDIGRIPNFEVETAPNGFNGLDFSENLTNGSPNGAALGHTDIFLPSVVWSFNENFAVGLLTRSRSFYDYNDISSDLLKTANRSELEDPSTFINSQLNNTTQSWTEVGLNLSAVLINSNNHFIKFGVTGKYYMGAGANEVRGSLEGEYSESGDIILTTEEDMPLVSLNTYPTSTDDPSSTTFTSTIFDFSQLGTGFGGDVGFVYEWRPRETNRVGVRTNSGAVNKYKLKVSASVLDIGEIEYKNEVATPVRRDEITLNNATIPQTSITAENGLISALIENGDVMSSQGDVTFALPMSLHLNLDYIILNNNNYYININYINGLTKVSDQYTNTQLNLITVTPRYETRKLSVYLPINYQETGGISAGLGARFGPISVGAAALSSLFTDGKMRHLYFGLSIPLLKDLYR